MESKTQAIRDVLRGTEERLRYAELGLDDLKKGPQERRMPGFWNLVVWGRATTIALQGLKRKAPGFVKWYAKYEEEMGSDELMTFFNRMRNVLLKKAKRPELKPTGLHINELRLPEDLAFFGPPPPFATEQFIGDKTGGSGWIIGLPDGSTEKFYVKLPERIASVIWAFSKPPKSHLGRRLEESSPEALGELYFAYLQRLVESAKNQFQVGP